jgi:hypothetical protein
VTAETPARTAGAEPLGLGALIDALELDDPLRPMLDWTSLDLARLLPGRSVFRPVQPEAGELPYLDHTIDIVLVDEADRMREAARVATDVVVRVGADDLGGAIAVETRRLCADSRPAPSPVLILVATHAADDWLARLEEAMAQRPGVEVTAAEHLAAARDTGAATVVLAERGVLPLPGCIEAAERLLAHDQRVGGVAVKLFAADGSLAAAGGAAFADGSVSGIAEGAPVVEAWHEYVRPVAAAVGLVVLRSAAARQIVSAEDADEVDLADVSARLWSTGWELQYQPDAVAVREVAPATAMYSWPLAADGLPPRPDVLDSAAWRRLLARGEVGAVR